MVATVQSLELQALNSRCLLRPEVRIQHLRHRPRTDLQEGGQRQAGLISRVLAGRALGRLSAINSAIFRRD